MRLNLDKRLSIITSVKYGFFLNKSKYGLVVSKYIGFPLCASDIS